MDQFQEIQKGVQGIMSIFLLGSGAILSLIGLFFWLAGLRSLRVIAGMSLAGIGFWLAWAFARDAMYVLAVVPIVAGLIGFIFKKAAGAMLGIATAGLLGVLMMTAPMLTKAEFWQMPSGNVSAEADPMASLNGIKERLNVMAGRFRDLAVNLPARAITLGTGCLIIAALLALIKPLWIAALYTASLGTAQIASGLVILLLYKGAQPLAYIQSRPQQLALAAAGMVLFGSLVQAALFKEKKKSKTPDMEKVLQGEKK